MAYMQGRPVPRPGSVWLSDGAAAACRPLGHNAVRLHPATAATGHAVRQLYLLCGATDVAVETGDDALLRAVQRLWDDAYGTKTYLTGGHGSRHRDEAFGDPYELPSDRAYNETCAAIASVMWNWRLLLATDLRRYADQMERALYNAVAGSSWTSTCPCRSWRPIPPSTRSGAASPCSGARSSTAWSSVTRKKECHSTT